MQFSDWGEVTLQSDGGLPVEPTYVHGKACTGILLSGPGCLQYCLRGAVVQAMSVTVPLRVLDLTDTLGLYGARLLVGLGADVVRIKRPHDPAPGTAQHVHWHAGKRIVEHNVDPIEHSDLIDRLALKADVVLESGPVSKLAGVDVTDEDLRRSSRWPGAIHVVVTPFGLTGPQRDWTGDDLVISAAGGMAWLGGKPDAPPRPVPRGQAVQLAGAHAALGALLGVIARDRYGSGQLIDISAQEATAATVETAAISWIHSGRYPTRSGGVYAHVAHRVFPTVDGYVAGGYSGSDRMWSDLLSWMTETHEEEDLSNPEWSDGAYRWAGRSHVDEVVSRFISKRPSAEIAREAMARALPWAEVILPENLVNNPQLQDRKFFSLVTGPGLPEEGLMDVGFPVESVGAPRPVNLRSAVQVSESDIHWEVVEGQPSGTVSPAIRPLDGLRVLDLTWVLAGPYATKTLAEHGADVIKVESRHRQDPTRFAPSMRLPPEAGTEDGGYFINFNRNKRSIAVNLRTAAGQELVRNLADECDIIIENYAPGVLARWGLDYSTAVQRNPGVLVVSMSGVGQTGPWRNAVTFADILAGMSGLTAETAAPGGAPEGLIFGLGDMVAANAAVLAVLDHVRRGVGGHIDLAQLEAMAATMGTAVLDAKLPRADDGPFLHGIYPSKDSVRLGSDRWIAISVADRPSWQVLASMAELSPATPVERRDADIANWTRDHDGVELAHRLQGAGISAAVVSTGRDLVDGDAQLAARRFYQPLRHPLAGNVKHEGIVIRMNQTPASLDRPAPLLGEHTQEVLQELLGLDTEQFILLQKAGALQ